MHTCTFLCTFAYSMYCLLDYFGYKHFTFVENLNGNNSSVNNENKMIGTSVFV